MHVTFRAPGGAHQAMKYGRTPQLPRWFVSCTRSPPFCFSFLHFFSRKQFRPPRVEIAIGCF